MGITFEVKESEEIKRLKDAVYQKIAECYVIVFKESWNEKWTIDSALKEIKRGLEVSKNRKPILTLMWDHDRVVGFSWIILTEINSIGTGDMPSKINEEGIDCVSIEEKRQGLVDTKYWFNLAKKEKIVIYKDLGILKDYQNKGKIHPASMLTIPAMEIALTGGYDVLFYWTSAESAAFKQGLGFGWHPIRFFPVHELIILKGGIKELVYYLQGVLDRDRQIMREMSNNRKKYYCT